MPILLALLSFTFARAAEPVLLPPPSVRPLFHVAHVGPDGTLMVLDESVLDRLLHRARAGDAFTIPLPDSDARLALDHASLDPKRDLDCCSVTLSSERGEAVIRLTHAFSVRDFEVSYAGKTYRVSARGNGNFLIR